MIPNSRKEIIFFPHKHRNDARTKGVKDFFFIYGGYFIHLSGYQFNIKKEFSLRYMQHKISTPKAHSHKNIL